MATPQSDGLISIYRNTSVIGTISLDQRQDFATGNTPQSVAVADYDGDGLIDLAVGNSYSNTVSVFRNVSSPGVIRLAPKFDLVVTGARIVVAKDVDLDGKIDLVTSNPGQTTQGTTISVLRNIASPGSLGPSSFQAPSSFAVGTDPDGMAIADLDNDGRPDIVTTNAGDNTISILQNITTTGPAQGLVAYYPFNGNANDASGNGNDGVVVGASLTTDRFGKANSAYYFDGSSNEISVPSSASLNFSYGTIAFWTFYQGGNYNPRFVCKNGQYDTWSQMTPGSEQLGVSFADQPGGGMLSNTSIARNQWTFVVLVKSSDSIRTYLNGVLNKSQALPGSIPSSTSTLKFGAHEGVSPSYIDRLQGKLDDIRIYNRVLSNAEIQGLYIVTSVSSDNQVAGGFRLDQNYPNPFNPGTTIEYQLAQRGNVEIHVYNSVGQLVRTLVSEQKEAGSYSVAWDGKSNIGYVVSSGMYFYQLKAGNFVQAKKMLLIK